MGTRNRNYLNTPISPYGRSVCVPNMKLIALFSEETKLWNDGLYGVLRYNTHYR